MSKSKKAVVVEEPVLEVQEPAIEAATVEEPVADALVETPEIIEAVVYLGPAIPKLINHGTVFSDGVIPPHLEAKISEIPAIKGLIVPVSLYAESERDLKVPGRLKTLYEAVSSKL